MLPLCRQYFLGIFVLIQLYILLLRRTASANFIFHSFNELINLFIFIVVVIVFSLVVRRFKQHHLTEIVMIYANFASFQIER